MLILCLLSICCISIAHSDSVISISDDELVAMYAPYLRFDSSQDGFPTTYNHPNGQEADQNQNSDISRIPTYYQVYRDDPDYDRPTSIGYHWYYEYQPGCIYDGLPVSEQKLDEFDDAISYISFGNLNIIDELALDDQGAHNNDNEVIYVNLNPDFTIKSVTFYQHGDFYTAPPHLVEFSATHPHVYIGRKSHGSFHNPSYIGGCGHFHDHRDGIIGRESWQNLMKATFLEIAGSYKCGGTDLCVVSRNGDQLSVRVYIDNELPDTEFPDIELPDIEFKFLWFEITGTYNPSIQAGEVSIYTFSFDGNIITWNGASPDSSQTWIRQRDITGGCKGVSCGWEYCQTDQQMFDHPITCTPLSCDSWSTGCMPRGVSDGVEALINEMSFKDKYAWIYTTGSSDCDCVNVGFDDVCFSENIKGELCIVAPP